METVVFYRKTFSLVTEESAREGDHADHGFVDTMGTDWSLNDPDVAKYIGDDTTPAADNPLHDANLIHECDLSDFESMVPCNANDVHVGADIYGEPEVDMFTAGETTHAYHVVRLEVRAGD